MIAAGTAVVGGTILSSPLPYMLYMTDEVGLHVMFNVSDPASLNKNVHEYSLCVRIAALLKPPEQQKEMLSCEELTGDNYFLVERTLTHVKALEGFSKLPCGVVVDVDVWLERQSSKEDMPSPGHVRFTACGAGNLPSGGIDGVDSTSLIASFHPGHDAHIAVLRGDGKPLFVLEVERLARQRYWRGVELHQQLRDHTVRQVWEQAADLVKQRLKNEFGYVEKVGVPLFELCVCNQVFASFGVGFNYYKDISFILSLLPSQVHITVNHHRSHAALGLWDAHARLGIRKPLVLSYDGGGNDGTFLAFAGNVDGDDANEKPRHLVQIDTPHLNIGNAYTEIGSILPEVVRHSCGTPLQRIRGMCGFSYNSSMMASKSDARSWLAIAGKLMGYAALGEAHVNLTESLKARLMRPFDSHGKPLKGDELSHQAKQIFKAKGLPKNTLAGIAEAFFWARAADALAVATGVSDMTALFDTNSKSGPLLTRRQQRNLAASAQKAVELVVVETLGGILSREAQQNGEDVYDGIVITGGSALNVLVNSAVARAFPNLPVYVPAAPSDCGLAVGQAWLVAPPVPRPDDGGAKERGSAIAIDKHFLSNGGHLHQAAQEWWQDLRLQYLGWPLFDEREVSDLGVKLGAINLSADLGPGGLPDLGVSRVAALLADQQVNDV